MMVDKADLFRQLRNLVVKCYRSRKGNADGFIEIVRIIRDAPLQHFYCVDI